MDQQRVILENRSKMTVSQVVDVDAFDEETLWANLADGAVECGVPRKNAMEYALRTLIGTAKLIEETGKHPGLIKDEVTSPSGTTIEGVRALERGAFRSSVSEAVIAAYEKTMKLKK